MSTFEANTELCAAPAPRTLSDLRSFLHGYRIKATGDQPRIARASIIIGGIDLELPYPGASRRAARELADLDPSLSWLPTWKPRVAVAAGGTR